MRSILFQSVILSSVLLIVVAVMVIHYFLMEYAMLIAHKEQKKSMEFVSQLTAKMAIG